MRIRRAKLITARAVLCLLVGLLAAGPAMSDVLKLRPALRVAHRAPAVLKRASAGRADPHANPRRITSPPGMRRISVFNSSDVIAASTSPGGSSAARRMAS